MKNAKIHTADVPHVVDTLPVHLPWVHAVKVIRSLIVVATLGLLMRRPVPL